MSKLTGNLSGGNTMSGNLSRFQGKSAYEIAAAHGFDGTEAEWLASLKGEPGQNGAPGAPGAPGRDGTKIHSVSVYGDPAGTEFYITSTSTNSGLFDGSVRVNDLAIVDNPTSLIYRYLLRVTGFMLPEEDDSGVGLMSFTKIGYLRDCGRQTHYLPDAYTEKDVGLGTDISLNLSSLYRDVANIEIRKGDTVIFYGDVYGGKVFLVTDLYEAEFYSAARLTYLDCLKADKEALIADVIAALPIYDGEVEDA